MENRFHFSLHLQFKEDVDIDNIESLIAIPAYKKTPLSKSKGVNKTAKLWYKSKTFETNDTYEIFNKYLTKMTTRFEIIKNLLNEHNGTAMLTLYFEDTPDKPFIKLEYKDMQLLASNNISFEVDFCV